MTDYQVCTVCVMDNTNPHIIFDQSGQCNCCKDAFARRAHEWWPGIDGRKQLDAMMEQLREQGRGKAYDAMIGLSGGVDSAYLAHFIRREYGLRLLAVHVDGGWNTEAAVRNIEVLVRNLDLDLHTYVVEWEEMRDLQLAFLRASVLNQDIPQDHAFFSTLYRTASKFGLRHFLSGVNYASESVIPPNWGYPSIDGRHVRGIHARFGEKPLRSFPILGLFEYLWMTRVRRQLTVFKPLDYLPYDKEQAKVTLTKHYAWKDYGGKHHESRFTRFYQEVYLPQKFAFDKRRLHLSSLIVSGQLTREAALDELSKPIADAAQAMRDTRFVAKKLGIERSELEALLAAPPVPHENYPNRKVVHARMSAVRGMVRKMLGAA
ncbi:MAG: N-acetyl sugar amidotransferase [Pseudomonadota bacterium]